MVEVATLGVEAGVFDAMRSEAGVVGLWEIRWLLMEVPEPLVVMWEATAPELLSGGFALLALALVFKAFLLLLLLLALLSELALALVLANEGTCIWKWSVGGLEVGVLVVERDVVLVARSGDVLSNVGPGVGCSGRGVGIR
jgi:hypothetical protein